MSLRNDSASTPDTDCLMDAADLQEDDCQFRIYRLCPCETCEGTGKGPLEIEPGLQPFRRGTCEECLGEGRVRQRIASCPDEQALGVALVTLGREGEFDECPIGILDRWGEVGKKWIVNPWLPSARNVSDAARTLARSRKGER